MTMMLLLAACTSGAASQGSEPTAAGSTSVSTPSDDSTTATTTDDADSTIAETSSIPEVYFETLPPGSALPDGERCAQLVTDEPSTENRPENNTMNSTVVTIPPVEIDGADSFWNDALAPRITGDFAGTTEQILRWGACKWGFDEDVTKARAVTESSWRSSRAGDETDDGQLCDLIGLDAPCPQSYGLLQVKGTVHRGTYPSTIESSAYGVDYAMAWLRACFEGSMVWLNVEGDLPYEIGDEFGCVGAWFSGRWWDTPANEYVGEVRFHLEERTWESYVS